MLGLLLRVPLYRRARRRGGLPPLPVNLTVSVTGRCNSRCRTCAIWEQPAAAAEELTLAEHERIARSLGRAPYWLTISGGEPFLRDDLVAVVTAWGRHTRPKAITLPTNGLLVERIVAGAPAICRALPGTQLILNLSYDGAGAEHDAVRGVPGNAAKVETVLAALQRDRPANLTLGLGTVISRHNLDGIEALCRRVRELAPDSFVAEIAEERVELGTKGKPITPDRAQFESALLSVVPAMEALNRGRVSRLVRLFRRRYYRHVIEWLLDPRHGLPCFAGYASAQITPTGEVWACCIESDCLGGLREHGFDFKALWRSPGAAAVRARLRARDCRCPLANVYYTNVLCDPTTATGVVVDWLKSRERA